MSDFRYLFIFVFNNGREKKLDCAEWIFHYDKLFSTVGYNEHMAKRNRLLEKQEHSYDFSSFDDHNKSLWAFGGFSVNNQPDVRSYVEAQIIWLNCLKEGLIREDEDFSKQFGWPVALEIEVYPG